MKKILNALGRVMVRLMAVVAGVCFAILLPFWLGVTLAVLALFLLVISEMED